MTKSKKLSIFIFSLVLVLASFLFVACGKNDYSKTSLSASSQNIELFKGETNAQQFSVSINNPVGKMSNKLIVTNSNTFACKVEETVVVDYTTTYTITGLNGGDATITFTTEEGGVELDVNIKVREYSDTLSKASNSLYISSSKTLEPSSADFTFKESATERGLEYYFYGKTAEANLLTKEVLDDVAVQSNKFVRATLKNIGGKDYIIFENENGNLFTLGSSTLVAGSNDEKYQFVSVSRDGENYSVSSSATSVTAGEKFTFIAKYQGESNENILICEREFYVLIDINKDNFSHEFGYKIEGVDYVAGEALTSYKINGVKNGGITLIPDYKTSISDNMMLFGRNAVYATVYLEVTAQSTNELLKIDVSTEDTSVANGRKIKEVVSGTTKTYYIEINCATTNGATTNYNISFYYEGFENSQDENVNYTYSVPIEVRVIPTNLLVNNVGKDDEELVYTFYNSYASSVVGWQPFNFAVIPEGAEFDKLTIDLTNSNLQIRYKNIIYTTGLVEIENIRETVYIKGIDGAEITAENKELPITLDFNVIQADHMNTSIKYRIVKGAQVLDFKTEEFEECIYLDIDENKYLFNDLYADAEFSTMTFAHVQGTENVVRFEYDKENAYISSGYDYLLNFNIIPIECGAGTYTVTLDNGKMATINIVVLESLKDITIASTNEDNTITLLQEVVEEEGKSTLIYALNRGEGSYFDLQVIANSDEDSQAIRSVLPINNSQNIELANASANSQKFNVYLRQNGTNELIINVEGYTVENFRRQNKNINHIVNIVSYDLIEKLNVYKSKDGFGEYDGNALASYVNVYSNTSSETAREAILDVGVRNQDAFLFESPSLNLFSVESFDRKFVYWESAYTLIYKNGEVVDKMFYVEGDLNIYTVGNYGTFNTETMTFTAFSNLNHESSLSLIAHVKQYRNIYSYTINIKISIYEEVKRVTLQETVDSLEFSTLDREYTLIAWPTNSTATNPEIVALFKGGSIPVEGETYTILDDKSIVCITGDDGKTQIKLTLSETFLEKAVGYNGTMKGELLIVAKDWLDVAGNIRSEYQELAVPVTINFANGTEMARFTISDADDLLAVKDNLSAHYQIKTTIDVSSIANKLPLGDLTGSIVGVNEYACITGLNISNGLAVYDEISGANTSYFGLFKSISENAYIEYVQFEGAFSIGSKNNAVSDYSNIGLIAGENHGKLINVGAIISASNIYISQGNFGGLVGVNYGSISQDFTLFEGKDAEGNDSATRTFIGERLEEITNYSSQGRYFYDNLTPKTTVYMKDYVTINYKAVNSTTSITRIGGLVGRNEGLIQKIDSSNLSLTGYLNYMAYSLIKANISNLDSLSGLGISSKYMLGIVGGLVGESMSGKGQIQAGYNIVDESTGNAEAKFRNYSAYVNTDKATGDFKAGNGLIVGGDIWGYGFVSGVVGRIQNVSLSDDIVGITARAFVRGQKAENNVANLAIIANIESTAITGADSFSTAFAIQAVDDGRTREEASMAVLYNNEKIDEYTDDINNIGFGNFNNYIGVLAKVTTTEKPMNVFSYVTSRKETILDKDEDGEIISVKIENISKDLYYGDFVVVGDNEYQEKVILDQMYFEKGAEENLSLDEKFSNKMTGVGELSNKEIYYTYYYQVASADKNDITSIQADLDKYLNKITLANEFYPFVTKGEMTFISRNTDILTIDQMGKITIKKTGLVQVSATSVLNSNDALNFYIYVVNYFNSEYSTESKSSIIYPNLASTATPVDDSIIELRGENSATLYVKPNYSFATQSIAKENGVADFKSDSFGNASFGGVTFKLSGNDDITADVQETNGGNNLDIEIVGQTITIRKLADTQEGEYYLTITPRLMLKLENAKGTEEYYDNVNKEISQTSVNYKYGALYITNKNYNEVPIYTSKTILDTITVGSTDINEANPKYQIIGLDGIALQGTVDGLTEENGLFKVTISKVGEPKDLGLGRYEHTYTIKIEINTSSSKYTNRYNENIYGRYSLYIEADSNAGKNILINIDFEKTNIFSVVVDNYTSLNEATGDNGLGSTSKYAFPGDSGLLAITITPEDSDFDYILIENDDQNYQSGYSSALLGILARKNSPDGSNSIFEDGNIVGSVTSKGLKLTLNEIVSLYGQKDLETKENKYVPYNGVVYIKYNMTSNNVIDGSVSKINVKLVKDGEVLNNGQVTKELTIKLQNYVAVEIDGKEGETNQADYYMTYNVARGLKYKLNINSYGFRLDNVSLVSSNISLGSITQEDGEYFLQITSSSINYLNDNNIFDISVSVSQEEGDVVRTASSKTKIIVNEFVLNYNGEQIKDADIVSGMGDGIINVQVGSQTTFEIDLYEYVEYDASNIEVVNKIEDFFKNMAQKGEWTAYTNLLSDDLPDYNMTANETDKVYKNQTTNKTGRTYNVGYNDSEALSGQNYFFNFNGLNVLPVRTHLPEEKYYYFTFVGYFSTQNGVYVYANYNDDQHNSQKIQTTFVLNVYTSSSEESPIPVYDYEDLLNMQKGGYYILLNDITIPNEYDETGVSTFKPISANFASFDGNGHVINMGGTYNMGNLSNIGLFSTISEDTIVKNLTINLTASTDGNDLNTDASDTTYGLYGKRTVKFITTADSFIFGTIASENEGIITNCHVITDNVNGSEYYLTVKADNALTGSSYIGGLVGSNSGYITNSGTSINVKAPFNIGGVTAQNYNKISGCYFKDGKLINNSQFDQHIAGFAITNSKDAQILSSFVAGEQNKNSLISQDSDSSIESTLAGAGFIYENRGKIQDCYTDINLSKTTSEMAGFAYRNGGTIKNSFSLSVLRNNVTASAGFVKENVVEGSLGEFSNCYYFYNKDGGSADDGFVTTLGNINTSLYDVTYEGVEKLNAGQFNNIETYFADYSYQTTMGTNAIWFHSQGNTSTTYVDYIPTTEKIVIAGSDGNTQTNTIYKSEIMNFGKNRLELVNPNIKTLSIRNFSYSEYDQTTGDITYFYIDDSNSPNRGSIHNPRLISNAENMESEILEATASTKINTTNYRLISDIEYEGHSSLYKVIFAGMLEGNGMEVSRISLVSMDKLDSAGMFAQIGYSSNKTGTIKNLTISPAEVSFNSTNNVGTLAGVLKYGEIYNIKVNAIQGTASTVTGLNFVGGVVGRAVSSFVMKDIYSLANASASYSPVSEESYIENQGSVSNYSYAGAVVGFAGNGTIYNVYVDNISSVMGSRAGFAYGGLGKNAVVNYTYVNIKANAKIKAYHYGGFIVGENSGKLSYSFVSGNDNIESTFSIIPKVAIAVGGVAGRLNGGLISNAIIEQDFRVTNSTGTDAVANVGGIVGLVSGASTISSIEECKVTSNITATNILGGGVGQVASPLSMKEIAISSDKFMVVGERANPILGGIVASVSGGSASISIKQSYCTADLEIKTSTSGVSSTAYAGGLIGNSSRTPELEYCYTSSVITAEVYDSRQTGSTADFASVESDNARYANKVTKNDYSNVYYLGSGESDSAQTAYTEAHNAGLVSFLTKVNNVPIGLTVNNYGTSAGVNETAIYNTFGNNFQLNSQNLEYNPIENTFKLEGKTYSESADEKGTYKFGDSSFKYGELVANRIYKDSKGEYYIKEYSSGEVKYRKLNTASHYSDEETLVEVWSINVSSLSTLAFENDYSWMNKT